MGEDTIEVQDSSASDLDNSDAAGDYDELVWRTQIDDDAVNEVIHQEDVSMQDTNNSLSTYVKAKMLSFQEKQI